MTLQKSIGRVLAAASVMGLVSCGGFGSAGSSNSSAGIKATPEVQEKESTIWDLLDNKADPNTTIAVNRYIWTAALDVLSFLPVEAADPFSGVIVMGYGTPPGGGRAYRATVYVQDPALDARSLNLAIQTRNGPASAETVRAVEDAILTRARQLRIADSKL
ncbi:DUF3576 domain-containing protein [Pseudogemmobacter sp. W21_MBD1_M6]|uniref:DUF3576 domain-containing protein n=1 Tax=Pseudogemmobacter sp. W21_MBD1_M6 TaxID=3240271 RepID=UPI003F9C6080